MGFGKELAISLAYYDSKSLWCRIGLTRARLALT
jgi:hypothetical protein